MHFVYILQSLSSGQFYIGHTDHLLRRFHQHQTGQTAATRGRGPWTMPYTECFPTRQEAVRREAELKRKKSAESLRRLIEATDSPQS